MSLAGAIARGCITYAVDQVVRRLEGRQRMVRFETRAREVLGRLPSDVSSRLQAVRIVIKRRPGPEDIERGATPTHRGYFWGTAPAPITATEIPDATPARGELVLFADNHTSEYEIERTLLHELAHVVGHSEQEICESMGLAP